jgi:hypothetical protein
MELVHTQGMPRDSSMLQHVHTVHMVGVPTSHAAASEPYTGPGFAREWQCQNCPCVLDNKGCQPLTQLLLESGKWSSQDAADVVLCHNNLPELLCELQRLAHHTLLGVIVPHLHQHRKQQRAERQPYAICWPGVVAVICGMTTPSKC